MMERGALPCRPYAFSVKTALKACVAGVAVALAACSTVPANPSTSDLSDTQLTQLKSADTARENGDAKAAGPIYSDLITHSRSAVAPHIGLAAVDRKLGHAEEAVRVMTEAQTRQPENPDVLKHLGYALIDASREEEAIAVFDHLILIDPQNAYAYNGKAVAFDHSGNHLAAQELYKQALKLAPDSVPFRNNLAMSFILNDQLTQAIETLEQLVPQTTDNKTVRQNLALAYGLKGEKKKALALNMMDMSPEEAKENLKSYDSYARKHHKPAKPKAPTNQVGFIEPSIDTNASAMPNQVPETPAVSVIQSPQETPPPADSHSDSRNLEELSKLAPAAGSMLPLQSMPRPLLGSSPLDELEDAPMYPSTQKE